LALASADEKKIRRHWQAEIAPTIFVMVRNCAAAGIFGKAEEGRAMILAAGSRAMQLVRTVSMGALTTVLRMMPLLFDPFFGGMAVTIVAGLAFASLLTLFAAPVLYSTFFRLKPSGQDG
jgi:Cu/Ag efflux pump CusA